MTRIAQLFSTRAKHQPTLPHSTADVLVSRIRGLLGHHTKQEPPSLLHIVGVEHREGCPLTIIRFLEFSDQPTKPLCKLIAYRAHFGRRARFLRASQNHSLKLEQCIVNFVISQRGHSTCRITRGLDYCFPNNIAHSFTICAIKNVNYFSFGCHDGFSPDTKYPNIIAVTARHAPASIIASPTVAINATFAEPSWRCKILLSPKATRAPEANVIRPRSRKDSQDILNSIGGLTTWRARGRAHNQPDWRAG